MKACAALAAGIFCAISTTHAQDGPAKEPPTLNTRSSFSASTDHVVKPGDSLEKIARLHGIRVTEILAANGLKADSIIHPGQKIKLPGKQTPPASVAKTPSHTATHTVAEKETFAAISRAYGIPLDQLLAANPEIKPTSLRAGQTIRLVSAHPPTPPIARPIDNSDTRMILASNGQVATPPGLAHEPALDSQPKVRIQKVRIDREMTYQEFAARQGTNTRRLNQLNGLDLLDSALLAKGSELLAPAQP